MSPQVKANGQMCHEENGFCKDTVVFHFTLLLAPSISLLIHQAHHMEGDTMNNTHHYRGAWMGGDINNFPEARAERKRVGGRGRELKIEASRERSSQAMF